ncbi:hypothetical protein Pint_11968 [Pistacia integerrima]|uniref:Uncharacterized protein n=1 Tax=Pistacia integerrima TaxID=434235 RepID=A0ACC0XIK6_9ROSI|nr:hypothetical protein Pint_11968 [Pistacia integerrima]
MEGGDYLESGKIDWSDWHSPGPGCLTGPGSILLHLQQASCSFTIEILPLSCSVPEFFLHVETTKNVKAPLSLATNSVFFTRECDKQWQKFRLGSGQRRDLIWLNKVLPLLITSYHPNIDGAFPSVIFPWKAVYSLKVKKSGAA